MPNPFQQEFSGMNDPLGFVKKLWGDMQLPGMVTPTVSIDELDKKIQDLKTVESWLTVNMNMVKGTIQALEVQRATIATLKSMGESFAQQMQASHSTESSSDLFKTTSSEDSAASSGHIRPDWPMPESTSQAKHAEDAPTDASDASIDDELEQDSTSETDSSAGNEQARAAKPAGTSSTTSPASSPFGSPAAWWELLQDQFKQAVSKAMQSDPQQTTSESAKASRKSASSTSSATASTRKAKPATTSTRKKAGTTTATATKKATATVKGKALGTGKTNKAAVPSAGKSAVTKKVSHAKTVSRK